MTALARPLGAGRSDGDRPEGSGVDEALVEQLLARLDLAQQVRLVTGATMWETHPEPAVGLRALVTSDGPVGVRGQSWDERDTSATTPSPTALAATWDPALVARVGALLAAECRRKGVDVLLAPTINLHRSPLGGRHFEAYSEDPVLTGAIGAAFVRGVQSGGVAATAKHYVANDSETERFTVDARLDERTLRELYLAPFERLVREGGAWVVMSAYNSVNGASMSTSPLLAEPLKGSWAFDGLVVSDWTAVRTTEESGRAAQDLAMPGPDGSWGEQLLRAVQDGRVPASAVADKVRRLLRLAARVGALDGARVPRQAPPAPSAREQAALLRRTAAAGAVLLRNEGGLLPLPAPSLRRVAVLGPGAASARVQGGGSAEVFPPYVVSPLQGLRAALGPGVEVVHAVGAPTSTGPAALCPAPIGTDDVRDPATGEPGVRARFLDAHGAELDSQHRRAGRLVWSPSEVPEGAAQVEVTARLRPEVAGRWQVGVAGTGRYALDVDGATVFDGVIEMDSDDIAAVALAPPYEVVDVELAAGQVVDLAVRHQVGTAVFGVSATLGAARPAVPEDEQMAAAVALARSADAVVVVVGTTSEIESEGFDRTTLALPGRQDELVRAVAAANPRTAVVVNSGGPVALPWLARVPAVLLSWFPGQECGHALADVLTGAAEPGGRLPTTWAAVEGDGPVPTTTPTAGRLDYAEGLHVGHRGWLRAGAEPAAWFGHGLGYTTWRVGDVTAPPAVAPGEAVTVRARVANTGARRGAEVVQVYLSRPDSALERPARWLAGFARVEAGAGEEVDVEVEVPRRAFEHWSAEHGAWATEPGEFRLHVGRSVVAVDAELAVSAT